MRNIRKKQEGITLIALVITIIVLLLLAGISISMLSGQDGILNKATRAKEATSESEEYDKMALAVQEALVNGMGKIDLAEDSTKENSLKKALEEAFKGSEMPEYEVGKIKLNNGETYNVDENGNVSKETLKSKIEAENYGDKVSNYTANGLISEWRVFLNDGNNVWLIASKGISINDLNIEMDESSNDAYCNDLLNKSKWNSLVDSNYADKAQGGATIQQFAASYNAKYPNNKLDYKLVSSGSNNFLDDGYALRLAQVDEYSQGEDSQYINTVINLTENEGEGLYFPDPSHTYRTWIASPGTSDGLCVLQLVSDSVSNGGIINLPLIGSNTIRPVVCLKSSINGTSTTEGGITTWTLTNE